MQIQFFNAPHNLKNKSSLKKQIGRLLKSEQKQAETINIIFCSDDNLLVINKEHLNHNYYTDIITFDLTPINTSSIIAELYISIDRVRENAKNHRTTIKSELHRVVFHGILHLCGYNDKTKTEQALMREKEEEWLNKTEF